MLERIYTFASYLRDELKLLKRNVVIDLTLAEANFRLRFGG